MHNELQESRYQKVNIQRPLASDRSVLFQTFLITVHLSHGNENVDMIIDSTEHAEAMQAATRWFTLRI